MTWWGPERKVSGCVSWAGLLARHAHPRFERRRLVMHTAFFVKDVLGIWFVDTTQLFWVWRRVLRWPLGACLSCAGCVASFAIAAPRHEVDSPVTKIILALQC